jgi:hypothetical protein
MQNSESWSSSGPQLKVGDLVCCIKDRSFRELPDGKNKLHLYHKKGNFYKVWYIDEKRILMSCETKNNNDTSKWYFKFCKDKTRLFENYFATGIQLRKLKLEKIKNDNGIK